MPSRRGFPRSGAYELPFLTSILRPPSPITSTEVLNPDIPKRIVDEKEAVLDILVKLNDGTRVNVEMQLSDPANTWVTPRPKAHGQ